MWTHCNSSKSNSFTEDKCQCQSSCTGIDVNCGSASEVECAKIICNPSACFCNKVIKGEDPVCDWEINQSCPDSSKDHPCSKFRTICNRTRDQSNSDGCENSLEGNKDNRRDCSDERRRVIQSVKEEKFSNISDQSFATN